MKINITKARKMVIIAYEIILDRTPSKSEVDYWSKKIIKGEISDETDLIYAFVNGAEFKKGRKK